MMNFFSLQLKSRGAAILGVCVLWALLYLPCLGTTEIQGEEGRRALPAMAMLKHGDWVLPDVGGEAYTKKPPLLNWCIAGTIKAFGTVNLWSMRLPSALSALALAIGALLLLWRFLGATGAWLAAVFLLLNATMLEKGRLAELEALTVACFGLAFLCWFYGEMNNLRFKHWLGAGLFLGLGFMTKGPLPLVLFFYVPVILVLWKTRRLRELVSPGHLLCVVLAWAPLVLWGMAVLHQLSGQPVSAVWFDQISKRATVADSFKWSAYLESIIRALFLDFAPWILLTPLLWSKRLLAALSETERPRFTALRLAFFACLLVIALMPGGRARYPMPLLTIFMVLLAWALTRAFAASHFPWWQRILQTLAFITLIAAPIMAIKLHASIGAWVMVAVIVLGAILTLAGARKLAGLVSLANASAVTALLLIGVYVTALLALPESITAPENIKARQITAALPADAPLYAVNAGSERILVHLGLRVDYLTNLTDLPATRPLFVTAITTNEAAILAARPDAQKVIAVKSHNGNTIQVLRLE